MPQPRSSDECALVSQRSFTDYAQQYATLQICDDRCYQTHQRDIDGHERAPPMSMLVGGAYAGCISAWSGAMRRPHRHQQREQRPPRRQPTHPMRRWQPACSGASGPGSRWGNRPAPGQQWRAPPGPEQREPGSRDHSQREPRQREQASALHQRRSLKVPE